MALLELGQRWVALLRSVSARPGGPEKVELLPYVMPTVQLPKGLVTAQTNTTGVLVSTGWHTLQTVPANEFWILHTAWAARAGGDRNIKHFRVNYTTGASAVPVPLVADEFSATAQKGFIPTSPFPLPGGSEFQGNITGGTTDGAWSCQMWVETLDSAPYGM
jgi:hypothetical protein